MGLETTWWSLEGGDGRDVVVCHDGRRYTYRLNHGRWPEADQPRSGESWRTPEAALADARLRAGVRREPVPSRCTCGGDEFVVRSWDGAVVSTFHDCRRPRPRCVMCRQPLDDRGRCDSMLCQHYGLPVPLPDRY